MTNLWPVVESTVWRNCQVIWCWGQNIFTCISVEINQLNVQWNPDFLNPRFLKPHDNSNQKSFPLDLLHSNTVILPPISWTLDNSKLPQTQTNSWLLWEKLTLDNSNLWKFRNHLSADFSYIRALKQINTSDKLYSLFLLHSERQICHLLLEIQCCYCTIEGLGLNDQKFLCSVVSLKLLS